MLENIALNLLHPDPRSCNVMSPERFQKLKVSIEHTGRVQPLIIRPYPKKKGQFIIIDGHYRKKALEALGHKEVVCLIWDMDEKESGLLLASLNRLRGEDHPGKRAELLHSLKLDYGAERLCQLIPESQTELEDLLRLLSSQDQEIKEMLERQQAEEAKTLPVMMNFVLSQTEAELVQTTLLRFAEDRNVALVKLCEEVNTHEQS